MEDQDKVVGIIKKICDEYWSKNNLPVLLSALPQILEKEIPDFRDVFGHRTLKVFIKETQQGGGYELVEHPTQLAKVSVAPASANFSFPMEPTTKSNSAAKSDREVTLAFLKTLGKLPNSDLESVVIPVSVLVKLLK